MNQRVRALCEELDIDPIAFMLQIIKSGAASETVIENGKRKRIEVTADLAMRVDLAKWISRFTDPMLTATQLTGPNEGPIATVDVTALLRDPGTAAAAQALALAMAERPALPAPPESDQSEPTRFNPQFRE